MPAEQWARLCEEVDCGLRRGAWYRVVSVGPSEVAVSVCGEKRPVSRQSLEIVTTPPPRWTVVAFSRKVAVPTRWARDYAVCPSCRTRQLPVGQPNKLRCDRCNGLFEVAWDESYLAGGLA